MKVLTHQQNDFLSSEGNVVLKACPGSGKTYIVARKFLKYVSNWAFPHQGVAVLSFTNVAREEVEKQVHEITDAFTIGYPHFVGTIDSFINNFVLLRFGYLLMQGRRPIISVAQNLSSQFKYWRGECYRRGCVDNIHEFRWGMNGKLYRKNELVHCGSTSHEAPCVQVKKNLLRKGIVFQVEVPGLSYLLLRRYPEIAKSIANRFPIIMLDEAQDTSQEQMSILDVIREAGTRSLILVGDPDQSIYEWRDATPKCFLEKLTDKQWVIRSLTTNFRNSQHICNATFAFASSLADNSPNSAGGPHSNDEQKPVLLLFDRERENYKEPLIQKFIELSNQLGIPNDPSSRAIVTRGKIHKETDVINLWKSREVEWLAQAAFQWYFGSRRRAYLLCETALFSIVGEEQWHVEPKTETDIEKTMPFEKWQHLVIALLTELPSPTQPLHSWIEQISNVLSHILLVHNLPIPSARTVQDIIKIKNRDKGSPHFKEVPVKHYFEVKKQDDVTLSSVHGVKGETYDSLMLIVESKTGRNTLTPKLLNEGDLDQELMRIAYVAMTRPRRLLVVAMPKVQNRKVHQRFPIDKWDYDYLE